MTIYQELKNSERHFRNFSKTIREMVPSYAHCYEIIDVDGFDAPNIKGDAAYYTTPSGKTRVWYPNAYKWPCIRHGSTRYIEVGRGWLIEKGLV